MANAKINPPGTPRLDRGTGHRGQRTDDGGPEQGDRNVPRRFPGSRGDEVSDRHRCGRAELPAVRGVTGVDTRQRAQHGTRDKVESVQGKGVRPAGRASRGAPGTRATAAVRCAAYGEYGRDRETTGYVARSFILVKLFY